MKSDKSDNAEPLPEVNLEVVKNKLDAIIDFSEQTITEDVINICISVVKSFQTTTLRGRLSFQMKIKEKFSILTIPICRAGIDIYFCPGYNQSIILKKEERSILLWIIMYAISAAMFTTPRLAIPITELPPEPLLRISLTIGYAHCAVPERIPSQRNNN